MSLNQLIFFISNYCFTELYERHTIGYYNNLLSKKVTAGFITWQTGLISLDTISDYITYKYNMQEEYHKRLM